MEQSFQSKVLDNLKRKEFGPDEPLKTRKRKARGNPNPLSCLKSKKKPRIEEEVIKKNNHDKSGDQDKSLRNQSPSKNVTKNADSETTTKKRKRIRKRKGKNGSSSSSANVQGEGAASNENWMKVLYFCTMYIHYEMYKALQKYIYRI